MTILSLLAIMAYNCMFPVMQTQPLTYLMYQLYFRSRHCDAEINWSLLLGSTGDLPLIEAQLPIQAAAVTRTFVIGIHYLLLNLLLTFAAITCICEWLKGYYQIRRSTSFLVSMKNLEGKAFNITFASLVALSASVLFLDIVAMSFYLADVLRAKVRWN